MKFENWGLISYEEGLQKQLDTLERVSKGDEDTVVFCSHPAVVTIGRSTQSGDITTWEGDIVEIQRGGRATYHGPSQLVIYPILNLNLQGRDLHKYLRGLEDVIVEVLKKYELKASSVKDATGVWVGEKKVASIGIGVKKWISYHGLALNVEHDSQAFKGLKPCGFTTETMTSVEALCGRSIHRDEMIQQFQDVFLKTFSKETLSVSVK